MDLQLNSKLENIKGIGNKYQQNLNKFNIRDAFSLLLHFPTLYIDFSRVKTRVELEKKNLYQVEILSFALSRNYRRRSSLLKIKAQLGGEKVEVLFFNRPYLKDSLQKNQKIFIYGSFTREDPATINSPIIFLKKERHTVVPLYQKIGTMKTGVLKKVIENCLTALTGDFEWLPETLLIRYRYPNFLEALRGIHFPTSYIPEQIQSLKERFIYSEFLFFQLQLQYIRRHFKKVPRVNRYSIGETQMNLIKKSLSFQLTADQRECCQQIFVDLQGEVTMQRLLQGDVGTGKTVLAFIALLLAVSNGFQGAFLAPTEILAQQHFVNARAFFGSLSIAILTGSSTAAERKKIQVGLVEGTIDIVFGTHALLNRQVRFKNLSMVVIDEQHRFGVSQRAALYYKGKSVDLVVTTATPIPRTMLLSLYNDLSVSLIKSKPLGKKPIITKLIGADQRDRFYLWLKKKIVEGEKTYIILPLIENSEFFSELRSIESETGYFKEVFKDVPFAVVSGKTSPTEKERRLQKFKSGRLRVLVATTVVEVGIDVRDATFMVIEDADRYGLSQLHQLRGRVGRGEKQSFCYLFATTTITESGRQRLQTMVDTDDGFKVAEIDLKMRGGGLISGLEQSGELDFKVGDVADDIEVFNKSRDDAAMILSKPSLQNRYIKSFLKNIDKKLKDISFS